MQIFKTKTALKKHLLKLNPTTTLGFVPTMGALHQGHLELILNSIKECDITICSIFVNPTQFNNKADLENYPSTLTVDLNQLEEIGCNIVYTPSVEDLYAKNEAAKAFDFGTLATAMEGKFRPGHFNGMATIVEKFFNIIEPTKAYFGQKDLQQLQIVRALIKQNKFDIELISTPTIREENGLAKSSRNKHLNEEAKQEATLIFKSLEYCRTNKNLSITQLKQHIEESFKKQPNFRLEYAEFVALNTMQPITEWEAENESAICIAAYHSGIRLIDNIIL